MEMVGPVPRPMDRSNCDTCGFSATTKVAMKKHMMTHSADLSVCQLCDKQFASRKGLVMHEARIHKAETKTEGVVGQVDSNLIQSDEHEASTSTKKVQSSPSKEENLMRSQLSPYYDIFSSSSKEIGPNQNLTEIDYHKASSGKKKKKQKANQIVLQADEKDHVKTSGNLKYNDSNASLVLDARENVTKSVKEEIQESFFKPKKVKTNKLKLLPNNVGVLPSDPLPNIKNSPDEKTPKLLENTIDPIVLNAASLRSSSDEKVKDPNDPPQLGGENDTTSPPTEEAAPSPSCSSDCHCRVCRPCSNLCCENPAVRTGKCCDISTIGSCLQPFLTACFAPCCHETMGLHPGFRVVENRIEKREVIALINPLAVQQEDEYLMDAEKLLARFGPKKKNFFGKCVDNNGVVVEADFRRDVKESDGEDYVEEVNEFKEADHEEEGNSEEEELDVGNVSGTTVKNCSQRRTVAEHIRAQISNYLDKKLSKEELKAKSDTEQVFREMYKIYPDSSLPPGCKIVHKKFVGHTSLEVFYREPGGMVFNTRQELVKFVEKEPADVVEDCKTTKLLPDHAGSIVPSEVRKIESSPKLSSPVNMDNLTLELNTAPLKIKEYETELSSHENSTSSRVYPVSNQISEESKQVKTDIKTDIEVANTTSNETDKVNFSISQPNKAFISSLDMRNEQSFKKAKEEPKPSLKKLELKTEEQRKGENLSISDHALIPDVDKKKETKAVVENAGQEGLLTKKSKAAGKMSRCDDCRLTLPASEITKHIVKTHPGQKMNRCIQCKTGLMNVASLAEHNIKLHNKKDEEKQLRMNHIEKDEKKPYVKTDTEKGVENPSIKNNSENDKKPHVDDHIVNSDKDPSFKNLEKDEKKLSVKDQEVNAPPVLNNVCNEYSMKYAISSTDYLDNSELNDSEETCEKIESFLEMLKNENQEEVEIRKEGTIGAEQNLSKNKIDVIDEIEAKKDRLEAKRAKKEKKKKKLIEKEEKKKIKLIKNANVNISRAEGTVPENSLIDILSKRGVVVQTLVTERQVDLPIKAQKRPPPGPPLPNLSTFPSSQSVGNVHKRPPGPPSLGQPQPVPSACIPSESKDLLKRKYSLNEEGEEPNKRRSSPSNDHLKRKYSLNEEGDESNKRRSSSSRDLFQLGTTDPHEEMSKYDPRQPTSSFNLRKKGREAKGAKKLTAPLGPLTNLCREFLTKDQLIFDCVSGELQIVESKQKEFYQVLRQGGPLPQKRSLAMPQQASQTLHHDRF